jgi:hypothetical protein
MNLAVETSPPSDLDPSVGRLARPYVDPRLDQIRSRVAPVTLAHEQTMPIVATMAELFTERALVRGRTLVCTGPAATSVAMEMVSAAVVAGSWLAVVDVPTFGLDAASETGIPLERVVAIASEGDHATHGRGAAWVDVMAAAVDGFDVVVARQPDAQTSEAALRKLSTRIRQRGAVVVVLDDAEGVASDGSRCDGLRCDGIIESSGISWSGLGAGHGHLRARTVDLSASGRRFPGRRRCQITLVRSGRQAEHAAEVTLTATPAPFFGSARDDVA